MKYLNIRDKKFSTTEREYGTFIESKLKVAGSRAIRWTPGSSHADSMPCDNEAQVPPGWKFCYDFDMNLYGTPVRFTICDGAVTHAFKPYHRELTSRNLHLENVTTKITVVQDNKKYNTLKFERVEPDE